MCVLVLCSFSRVFGSQSGYNQTSKMRGDVKKYTDTVKDYENMRKWGAVGIYCLPFISAALLIFGGFTSTGVFFKMCVPVLCASVRPSRLLIRLASDA